MGRRSGVRETKPLATTDCSVKISDLIRQMAHAGAPPEAIAIAVEAIEAAQALDAERRAKQAERKRRSRDSHGTVTGHGCDTPPPSPSPSPKPPSPTLTLPLVSEASLLRHVATPPSTVLATGAEKAFDERFWPSYPKRGGTNSRKHARKVFVALVCSGHDAETMIAGLNGYRAHCTAKGIIGTGYVKQAEAWLRGALWEQFMPQAPDPDDGLPVFAPPGARTTEEILASIEEEKRARADRAVRGIPQEGNGAHPEGEEPGQGSLLRHQAGNVRVGAVERLLRDTVRAASVRVRRA
jgi:hypothetical protein